MKISKIFAGMSAMALAASMLTVAASADDDAKKPALLTCTVEKSSGPSDNTWAINPLDYMTEEQAAKVEKIEATVTSEAYANGALGVNSAGASGWLEGAQCENGEAGTSVWSMEGIGGLAIDVDEETGDKSGYVQFQIWWMNAIGSDDEGWTPATATLDKVVFLDAEGTEIVTVEGEEAPAPAPYENVYAADIEANGNLRIELFNIYGDSANNEDWAVAYETFTAAKEIEVQFTIQGVPESEEGFTAFLMYTDKNWAWGNWNAGTEVGAVDAVVNADGTYSVKINNEIAGATAEDGGAMIATGANVFCVDILGLADAAGAGTADTGLETAADKQALAVEKGLVVTDVKVFTDGKEFVPGVGYKDDPIDDSSSEGSSSEASSSEAETSSSEAEVSSSESTADSTSSKASSSSSKATNNNTTTNPNTGAAALAAVGVALAGAAVVASKKRK